MLKNRNTVGSRQYVARRGLYPTYYLLPTTYLSSLRLLFFIVLCVLCFAGNIFAEGEFVYDAKGKRNPFIVLITPDGLLLKLDAEEGIQGIPGIEGIIYDKNGVSYALVNGEVVKIGDMVGAFQVLKIETDKVTFVKEGTTLEVEFKKE